jgi:hypothetical protein
MRPLDRRERKAYVWLVILSYRDERTKDFAEGKRVKALSGIERSGTSPQFWLNLQSLYELRLAEQKAGKSIKILPTLKKQAPAHP